MTTHIPESQRQEVILRAGGTCEYCGLPQAASPYTHHVDHILADVHGWPTTLENLALACATCNERKGPNLASRDPETDLPAFLYSPRRDQWEEHFRLTADGLIHGETPSGRATVNLLRFNEPRRVAIRLALMRLGRYPRRPS